METTLETRVFTPEDLLIMPDGDRYELIDGRLVERVMSVLANYISGVVYHLLMTFCLERKLGWVLPDGTTFQCFPHQPARVRKPDVAFIAFHRMSVTAVLAAGHCRVVPDLAVEVVSPNDTVTEIDERVDDFLKAGTRLVWVVHPGQRYVRVFRANGEIVQLRDNQELTGDDAVPGFRCPVSDLFRLPTPAPIERNGG